VTRYRVELPYGLNEQIEDRITESARIVHLIEFEADDEYELARQVYELESEIQSMLSVSFTIDRPYAVDEPASTPVRPRPRGDLTERKKCKFCNREYSAGYVRKHQSICMNRHGAEK
jgi:hypothetical protein